MKLNWTLAKCKASATNYSTRSEWRKGDTKAYIVAQRKGWPVDCCEHMDRIREAWSLEKCKASAAKYNTREEWIDACCEHMRRI